MSMNPDISGRRKACTHLVVQFGSASFHKPDDVGELLNVSVVFSDAIHAMRANYLLAIGPAAGLWIGFVGHCNVVMVDNELIIVA